MLEHEAPSSHPENPLRLKRIHDMFNAIKLNERCDKVPVSIKRMYPTYYLL